VYFKLNRSYLELILPGFIEKIRYYPSTNKILKLLIKNVIVIVFWYAIMFFMSFGLTVLVGNVLISRFRMLRSIAKLALLIILCVFSIYILHDLKLGFIGLTSLTLVCGGLFGVWVPAQIIEKLSVAGRHRVGAKELGQSKGDSVRKN